MKRFRSFRHSRLPKRFAITAIAFSIGAMLFACGSDEDPVAPGGGATGESCTDYSDYLHSAGNLVLPGSSPARTVAVSGTFAYVGHSFGFHAIDISQPDSPQLAGSWSGDGGGGWVAPNGDYAYASTGFGQLQVVSMSDPSSPQLVTVLDELDAVRGIALSGSYGFVLLSGYGQSGPVDPELKSLDLRDPTAPVVVGSLAFADDVGKIAIAGDVAYVTSSGGLKVVDIANPGLPSLAGTVVLPDEASANDVLVSGEHLYVGGDMGLDVFDTTVPTAPVILGRLVTESAVIGMSVHGDRIYLGDVVPSLKIVDVTNPAEPVKMGQYSNSEIVGKVAIAGDHAYLASGFLGLDVVDISTPQSPSVQASLDIPNGLRGVLVSGRYAYLALREFGFHVVDLLRPTQPSIVGEAYIEDPGSSLAISGDHVFVAGAPGSDGPGFQVLDVGDPTAPVLVATLNMGRWSSVALYGDIAFVTTSGGLNILDVSEPSNPVFVASSSVVNDSLWDIALMGDHAYVLASGSEPTGLYILAVHSPATPELTGSVEIPGDVRSVDVLGSHAYVASDVNLQGATLYVIDVLDSSAPSIVASLKIPGESARDTVGDGQLVYVAADNSVSVVDVGVPSSPVLLGTLPTQGRVWGVALGAGHMYIADDEGLRVASQPCKQ